MFRIAFLLLALTLSAQAQSVQRNITTQGTAKIAASPSIAFVQAGAITQAKTAKDAMEANAKIMNAVFAALKDLNLLEKDFSTTQVSLRPIVEYTRNTPQVTGYEAKNMLSLRLSAIEKLGETLDRVIQAGANTISEVQLISPENKDKLNAARREAVLNSQKDAELLVRAAGSKLGRVISIQETSQAYTAPHMRTFSESSSMSKKAPTPIAAGEQSQEVSVSVTWEIID